MIIWSEKTIQEVIRKEFKAIFGNFSSAISELQCKVELLEQDNLLSQRALRDINKDISDLEYKFNLTTENKLREIISNQIDNIKSQKVVDFIGQPLQEKLDTAKKRKVGRPKKNK